MATESDRVIGSAGAFRNLRAATRDAGQIAARNRPMLAVNHQLGYRPVAAQFACVTILKS